MSDSPQYEAFRAFARSEIRAQVAELKLELKDTLTREAPKVIEGAPGKDGRDGRGVEKVYISDTGELCIRYTNDDKEILGPVVGRDGKDGAPGIGEKGERGADGLNGKDGVPSMVPGPKGDTGERGADGIATREELNSLFEERFGELQVRTFADVYQGVYENGRLYTRGLLTTWNGHLWLSQAETRSKPGESPDWKLIVKAGRDAKK